MCIYTHSKSYIQSLFVHPRSGEFQNRHIFVKGQWRMPELMLLWPYSPLQYLGEKDRIQLVSLVASAAVTNSTKLGGLRSQKEQSSAESFN